MVTFVRASVDVRGTAAGMFVSDDDAALFFVGTELAEVWTVREGATAYRVEPDNETSLDARLLSGAVSP